MKTLLMLGGVVKVIGVSFLLPVLKVGFSLMMLFVKVMFGLMVAIIFSAK